MKIKGTVQRYEIEGGVFQLMGDDGRRYTLVGARVDLKAAQGARVEIDGEVEEGGFSFSMAGPLLRVSRLTKL